MSIRFLTMIYIKVLPTKWYLHNGIKYVILYTLKSLANIEEVNRSSKLVPFTHGMWHFREYYVNFLAYLNCTKQNIKNKYLFLKEIQCLFWKFKGSY